MADGDPAEDRSVRGNLILPAILRGSDLDGVTIADSTIESSTEIEGSGGGGSVSTEDDGTEVVADTGGFNFGTNLSVADDGDGTVTIDASGGSGDTSTLDGPNTTVTLPGSDDIDRAIYDRPLAGTDGQERTIYCSPNGSDSGEGTQADPITLVEMLRRIPYFHHDDLTVDLYTVPNSNGNLPAEYTTGAFTFRSPVINCATATAGVTWQGNDSNPDDVRITEEFGVTFFGSIDNHRISGITFENRLQIGGYAVVNDCNIETDHGEAALDTKNGQIAVFSSRIGIDGSPNGTPHALKMNEGGKVLIETSSLHSADEALSLSAHSQLHINVGCTLNGGSNVENESDETVIAAEIDAPRSARIHDAWNGGAPRIFCGDLGYIESTPI